MINQNGTWGLVKSIDHDLIPRDKARTKYLDAYDYDGDNEHFCLPLLIDLKCGDLVTL